MFFFEYPHSTGVHFEKILLYRFDPKRGKTGEFVMEKEFSLAGNYINCAAATSKYLVISYWPYDVEAVKRIIEGIERDRHNHAIIAKQQQEIARLQGQVVNIALQLDILLKVEAQRKKEMEEMRRREAQIRAQQEEALRRASAIEQARLDELRRRDPIHLYTRVDNCWQLVLDYHEGAFDLQILGDKFYVEYPQGDQHEFEIVATPLTLKAAKFRNLPVVPKRLCAYF